MKRSSVCRVIVEVLVLGLLVVVSYFYHSKVYRGERAIKNTTYSTAKTSWNVWTKQYETKTTDSVLLQNQDDLENFKAPCRPHESSDGASGKPFPVQSRQADTLVEKASEPVHLASREMSWQAQIIAILKTFDWRRYLLLVYRGSYLSHRLRMKSFFHVLEQTSGLADVLTV